MTVEDVASVIGVSRATAYKAAAAGELPTVRIGRRLLVPTAALRRLLALDQAGVVIADGAAPRP